MPIYSHSRLGTFENCPRQYWFAYIEKPDIVRVDTIEAFLGSRVHDVLEELHRRLLMGRLLTLDETLQYYGDVWAKAWSDGIRIVRKEIAAADYREVGRKAIRDYYERYQPFDQSQTLGLEKPVLFDLDDAGKYRMRGFIDRLAQRRDWTYEIHDYKTAGYLMTQAAADTDRQLALYHIGIQGMWNDVREVDLIWHYLRFDKEIRSRRTSEQLESLKAQSIALIKDVEARGDDVTNFPTQDSSLCDWCDYRVLCPATKHYVAVGALAPKQYKADEGVQLVDRWAGLRDRRLQLEEQAAALEAEEEAVQQEVLAFADQQGLESVAGSSCHADITQKVSLDYPRTGDDDRERFEAALRRAGLWDDVIAVNAQRLKSLWLSGEDLSANARKALQPFIETAVARQAKLKKGGVEEE